MSGIIYPSILTETIKRATDDQKKEIQSKKLFWEIAFLLSVVFGVLGRFLMDWHIEGGALRLIQLLVGLVLGIIIFPQFYKKGSFNTEVPGLVDLALAFQNGFFWQSLMPVIEKSLSG